MTRSILSSWTAVCRRFNRIKFNCPRALALLSLLAVPTSGFANIAITGITGGSLFVFNNQGFTVGYEFTVSQAITVDNLGFYDAGSDGLATAHPVGLYNLCGTLLASNTVPAGTSAPLTNGFRYVSITPIVLGPGTYRIGAVVFNGGGNDAFYQGVATLSTDPITPYVRGKINNGLAILQYPFQDATLTGLQEKSSFGANFTFTVGGTPPGAPEVNLKGNGLDIADGSTNASVANGTDFGTVPITGASVTNTFTIENLGTAPLTLSGSPKVTITGANANNFTVLAQPAIATIATNSSVTFTVVFDPSAAGIRTATMSFANDDCDENPYDVALKGTGANSPPTVNVPASPILVEATNASGATATFSVTATDPEDGTLTPVVTPVSGSLFPIGTNTVTARATDSGGLSVTNTFFVIVRDTTAPTVKITSHLYVANFGNNTIEKFTAGGAGAVHFSSSALNGPTCMALDGGGNLYVGSFNDNIVRKITPGGVISGFVTNGVNSYGLIFDAAGNLYQVSEFANAIYKITPAGVTTTFASGGLLNHPVGVAFDSSGNLYVANFSANNIIKITPAGATSIFASTGLNAPLGLAFDSAGNLFVGNSANNNVMKFTPAGAGTVFASGLSTPYGVAIDAADNVYVANTGNSTIQKFTPAGTGSLFANTGLSSPILMMFGPANQVLEATSAAGAVATYFSAAATDAVGVTSTNYSQASGTTFAIGTNTVLVTATDAAGNVGSNSFTITVRDTTAPALAPHGNVTAEATSASGAVVTYTNATATDAVGVTAITYSRNSGTTFPIGVTTVTNYASDAALNTNTSTFTVTVQDTTPPVISVPANMDIGTSNPAGATVNFSVSATDLVDGSVAATATPASGSLFPVGTNNVIVTAHDTRGNFATNSFTIVVSFTNTPPSVTVPASPVIVEATSASGAVVTFSVTATDTEDGTLTPVVTPASGSTFPLGTNTVTAKATDSGGLSVTNTFLVVVRDTTAPQISVPSTMHVGTVDPAGANVNFSATANDLVDGNVTANATPASGSLFPVGTNTVTVTAADTRGNAATNSFLIIVTTPPDLHIAGEANVVTLWWQEVPLWKLQQNDNLLQPMWLDITNAVLVGQTNYLMLTNAPGNEYYRLAHP